MITTAELTALAAHYCQTIQQETGRDVEVLRNMAGKYVAVFGPVNRVVPLGSTRDACFDSLSTLLAAAEIHTTATDEENSK
jgi:hypothetical protein